MTAPWQWAIVPGGKVWHAFADNAETGPRGRRAICGVWRKVWHLGTYWRFEPTSGTCDDCQLLWDERYVLVRYDRHR